MDTPETLGELMDRLNDLANNFQQREPEVAMLAAMAVKAMEEQVQDMRKLFDVCVAADCFITQLWTETAGMDDEEAWQHELAVEKELKTLRHKTSNLAAELFARERVANGVTQ
ncbi:hypothetical protein [Pseudodesulfovibrio indicus]|uniref:hypothetical protein n=1 Tax=Pseudodesulfovibrio indicus TaxID=1716143 RepID=UPI0029302ADA|nr:hypothetical protein [Pseudodesulfovibrio indicus]